jgi:hypothetical protein
MPEPRMVTIAVVISLVAGILIILDNLVTTEMIGVIRGWVGLAVFGGMASWIGLVAGFIVLIAAIMLRVRPGEATQGLRTCCIWWGSIILVFSIVGHRRIVFDVCLRALSRRRSHGLLVSFVRRTLRFPSCPCFFHISVIQHGIWV